MLVDGRFQIGQVGPQIVDELGQLGWAEEAHTSQTTRGKGQSANLNFKKKKKTTLVDASYSGENAKMPMCEREKLEAALARGTPAAGQIPNRCGSRQLVAWT